MSNFLGSLVLAAAALGMQPAAAANRYPVTITGTPPTTVAPAGAYAFTPVGRDPDGEWIGYSITNKPAWATFSHATGRLSGTAPASGTFSNIVITVTDGYFRASLAPFSITVSGTTTPSPAISPPTISGTPATSARVGQAYSFVPTATDPQKLPLTFSIANKPTWTTFSTSTGTLTGTPGAADVATFSNIVITASNGTQSSSLAPFSIAVQQASTGSTTLSWQPPTTRADGSPLANLAGYRVYYGTSQGNYPNQIAVNSPGISSYVVSNLPPGTYWFVVTAIDANGLESARSNATSRQIL